MNKVSQQLKCNETNVTRQCVMNMADWKKRRVHFFFQTVTVKHVFFANGQTKNTRKSALKLSTIKIENFVLVYFPRMDFKSRKSPKNTMFYTNTLFQSTDLQLEELRAELNGVKSEKHRVRLTNSQLIMEVQELRHKYEPGRYGGVVCVCVACHSFLKSFK